MSTPFIIDMTEVEKEIFGDENLEYAQFSVR
jgi:hypothetical protein